MKNVLIFLCFMGGICITQYASAEPIYKSGHYTRLEDTEGGFEIKCGWQFWQECFMADTSIPIVIFGDGSFCNCFMPIVVGTIDEGVGNVSNVYQVIYVN